MPINYIIGDAVENNPGGILANIVNDVGSWGRGSFRSVSRRWKLAETEYRFWHKFKKDFFLGRVQYVTVQKEPLVIVANLLAQRGLRGKTNTRPLQYDYLRCCFEELREYALEKKLPVNIPKTGCEFGGGKWMDVESIVKRYLSDFGVTVNVFSSPEKA